MKRVTFFTKPECTLCRGALFVIERVRQRLPFDLEIVLPELAISSSMLRRAGA